MDPTTRNHSYTPTTNLYWTGYWTGLDWTGMDYGRLVVLKRSLCNNTVDRR